MLSFEEAYRVLRYEPDTGRFFWRVHMGRKTRAGKQAGCAGPEGRNVIRVHGRIYQAARLAWLITYREWPENDVDHINGDPTDNRLCNLRAATRGQNMANKRMHKNNTSGVKGVHLHRQTGKWRAVVRINGKNRHLGLFEDKHEAGRVYFAAAQKLFGEFATTRGQQ